MIRTIGNRLILVGVAHILPKSMEEVEKTIREEEPSVVAVELCPKRYFRLMAKADPEREQEEQFSEAGIITKILQYFQEKMGKETGMFPGEEMLTAIESAQESGGEIKLIDRNIDLTVQRLLEKMSLWEKIRILGGVMLSFLWKKDEVELEELAQEEAVEELIEVLKETSESAYRVLIEERNRYMADKVTEILSSRSGKVVCVVGAGHVPGLSEELKSRLDEETLQPWGTFQMSW